MPIANCLLKDPNLLLDNLDLIVQDWAELSMVNKEDITLNFISDYKQAGNGYSVMANLYLPNCWSTEGIERIQLGLIKTLASHLLLKEDEIFVMTTLIHSGHVVDKGEIVRW